MEQQTENTLSFDTLNLQKEILKGVYLYGFKKPSNIQLQGISALNTSERLFITITIGYRENCNIFIGSTK